MKSMLAELNAINEAVYEGKPIISTEQLSKQVLDQFVKNNSSLIAVFEAAPLALLALAGEQHLQRQILLNAYDNREWLRIAYFNSIAGEIVAYIRQFDFVLNSEVDVPYRQEQLAALARNVPFFEEHTPVQSYHRCLDYLFYALANAVRNVAFSFRDAEEMLSYGTKTGFSDGYALFVRQLAVNTGGSELLYPRVLDAVLAQFQDFTPQHKNVLLAVLDRHAALFLRERTAQALKLCYTLLQRHDVVGCVGLLSYFEARAIDAQMMQRLCAPSIIQLQAALLEFAHESVDKVISNKSSIQEASTNTIERMNDVDAVLGYFARLSHRQDFTIDNQPVFLAVSQLFSIVQEYPALKQRYSTAISLFNHLVPRVINYASEHTDKQLALGLHDIAKFKVVEPYQPKEARAASVEPAQKIIAPAENKPDPKPETQTRQPTVTISLDVPEVTSSDVFGEDTKCDLDLKFV